MPDYSSRRGTLTRVEGGDWVSTGRKREPPPLPRYVYCFSPWPDETRGFPATVFDLFRMLQTRVEMEFTEVEFHNFRDSLAVHGITLREIERRPYHEPETVP
jgi:hypothetical protein